MAEEEDYLDLVIASELVVHWIDVLRTSTRFERLQEATEKLRSGVQRSSAYVEEAIEADALTTLKLFLERSIPEWRSVEEDVRTILTLLEKHATDNGKVPDLLVDLRPSSLYSFLASRNISFQDRTVLEIGSGCGSSGILAATMAPRSHVVLTDCVQAVLENLRYSCRLNWPVFDADRELECVIEQINDDSLETLSGEDISDDLLSGSDTWDVANMSIRTLNWDPDAVKDHTHPPEVPNHDTFEIIIGCEVLYEETHASLISALLQQRLRPDGFGLIAAAVRNSDVHNLFLSNCKRLRLVVEQKSLENVSEVEIDLSDYEGGVVLMAICHIDSSRTKNLADLISENAK